MEWFNELAEFRPSHGMGGALRIPNNEIRAWIELSGVMITRRECQALIAMDRVFCMVSNAELEAAQKAQQAQQENK